MSDDGPAPPVRRRRLARTIDREAYTPAYLSFVANAMSWGGSQVYLRHFGVGTNDWRLLSALANAPGVTAGEMCRTLGIDKSVVSRCVKTLVRLGLVVVEQEPGTRRHFLTADGAALHDRILPVALERERRLLSGFSDEEVLALRGFLRRLLDNLPAVAAYSPDDDPPSG